MAQIILGPRPGKKVDGSVKKAAYDFLEKLQADPTASGLHIEPINGSADPRIRTGRVNKYWRAVLVQIDGGENAHFVYLGTFGHDEAIEYAKKARVQVNPRNGIAEFIRAEEKTRSALAEQPSHEQTNHHWATAAAHPNTEPFLRSRGVALRDLLEIGIDPDLAEAAITVTASDDAAGEEEMLRLADSAPAAWQGMALIELGTGTAVKDVVDKLALTARTEPAASSSDDELIAALRRPAARLDFAFIESGAELRAAIEDDDFGRWRVFLHPEQRRYVERRYEGSFRLSGAAGTGKTVVLLHRARELARRDPAARIVLTTFTRTLAGQLIQQLRTLDPEIVIADHLGEPGVFVGGIDQIALRVLKRATARLSGSGETPGSVSQVLGARTPEILHTTPSTRWDHARQQAALPEPLRHLAFLQAEYRTVVLPNRITTREQYVRVRRPGRGTALSRPVRNAVWDAIETYRASAGADRSTDFDEKAMIAAVDLDTAAELADDARTARPADHVLVDEVQDLGPAHLHLVRALVAPGRDDLFLADDSQQRIYGNKFVMKHYGIDVRGRSRRLTLNYRTTAQNLRFAVGVLSGERYADLEDEVTQIDGYRSVRLGPPPQTHGTKHLTEAYRHAADLVTDWLTDAEQHIQPGTIGILVRQRHMGPKLVAALAEQGVEADFVEDDMLGSDRPVVMTMHRSKGMEFRRVILFDLSEASEPGWIEGLPDAERADARLRERSLVYVAASRARDELWVIWHGEPSPLLPIREPHPEEGPEVSNA